MSKSTILIVEDEAIVAADLANKLNRLGYAVVGTASQGEQAIDMVRRLTPQLVLMDIQLEGGLDGIQTAELIKEERDIPVIYLTAHSDPATLERAKLTGPFGYILKPFENRDLATQIELAVYKHKADRQLHEQREWLRVTLASIGDAVIATDAEGSVTFVNPTAEALTGFSVGESIGKPLEDIFFIINEHTRENVDSPVSKVLKTGQIVGLANHTILIRKDGKEIPIDDSGAPIRSKGGLIQGVVLVFRDISDRRQAEAEREKLLLAIEQVGETVVITDPHGIIQYVNPAFTRITGYTRREAIGNSSRILKSGKHDAHFYRRLWETITSGEIFQARMINKRKDGTLYTDDVTISPVFDTQKKIVAFVAVKRDVTAQLALEEQFHQAQKMESVGRLAGGVAHDFNNMLGIILGHTELAMEHIPHLSPLKSDLDEIQKAAQRSADLTRQLLAFARKQTASPKVINLNDTIAQMIKMLRRLIGEDIDLTWISGAGLWPVKIDPAQTHQLLANLCVNARDAINGVGHVTIETRNVTLDETYCGRHTDIPFGEYVMMAVTDNGCGMDENTRENLFEPFFTTKEVGQGTGLGLSTVYGIVKQNDGYIEVTSELGEGATFNIYLPKTEEDLEGKQISVAETMVEGSETVLVVEDEPSILRLTESVLERLGYTVITTHSPLKAIDLITRYERPIDLLITDVVMPGMNGQELMARIEELVPNVKVLFISGYTADAMAHRGFLANDIHFLQKPFSNKTLAEKVRTVLDQSALTNSDLLPSRELAHEKC